MRPGLTKLPLHMAGLPVDARGYPVPAFVEWRNGEPDFRIANRKHWLRCVKERRCWVCGDSLGVFLAFLIGPMCAVNRITAEPASHRDCGIWSAMNCPFLARPHMVRREDEVTRSCEDNVAGYAILRNPGVACVWIAKDYQLKKDGKAGYLIEVGEPCEVLWFAEGRKATRAEVEISIRTGMPILESLAAADGFNATEQLKRMARRAYHYLPE